MANEATILRIRAQVENLEGLNRARSAVRNFATESKAASNDLDKLRSLFKELGSESVRSVNNLKNYRTGLDALRQSAEIGSTTFKELTSEIRQLDTELGSLQGKQTQVAQGFNKITTATNSAIAAQRTYSGLIRNPLTGGYSMPPVQVPMGGRLLPAAQGFDFAAQDSRIQAQAAEASAQSARDARRRAKMQELANYSGTTIGARDPNTGALIAGGYGPFQNVGTQYNRPAGPQPARVRDRANLGRVGQTAGAIAAAGVFGGPEGFIGASLGAIGGPGGALAGGAIGAQVGIIRQQLSGVANYTKELNLAKITLAQASTGQEDYNKNLRIARQISADYTVGLKETIQGYSQVSVAAKANGLTLKDTENIYRGVVAAGTAFGKSQEDIDAIVRATVQVLSKGKLSAEELQGQIGERLPGAVAKFAEATGRSLPELAKDLEDGKVNIADFVKFTEKQVQTYDEIAKIIGASPEKSGERLKLALDTASENYGGFFLKISVMFSDSITKVISWFNQNSETIQRVVYLYYRGFKAISDFVQGAYRTISTTGNFLKEYLGSLVPAFGLIIKMSEIASRMQGKKVFKSATDNYKDLFPDFKPLANMFGVDSKQAAAAAAEAEDAKKKAAAEKLAAEQQQLAETTMQAQIRLADTVFQYQIQLDRKRYELQQELIDLQRQNYVDSLSGAKQDVASAVMQFKQQIDALDRRSKDAQVTVAQANQKLQSANQMLNVTGNGIGGSTSGVYTQGGYGPRGANSYGPHFDIAKTGGGYFSRNALDKFVTVNGRPLSSGATVDGGQYGASRDGGSRIHKAQDYAFGSGAQLSLRNGAQFKGTSRGSYGDNTVFMLPDGTVYRIIHGTFSSGITGKKPSGVAGQIKRATTDQGDVNVANADLAAAKASQKLTTGVASDFRKQYLLQFTNNLTKSIRDQTQSLEDANTVQALRNRLLQEGVRPEIIDIQAKTLELTQQQTQKVEQLNAEQSTMAPDAYNAGLKAINDSYGELINKTREAAQAQLEFNETMKYQQDNRVGLGFQDGAKRYVESIGTMREATSQLAQTGIKGVENALFELATTGATNFQAFAVSILQDTSRMIIQQLVLRSIMQAIGAIGGGGGGGSSMSSMLANQAPYINANGNVFAQNGIVPFANGGIVDRPMMFPFAKGIGLMGEAGPEAIMPLKRGADGKLGVAGGGGTSVTVNVDASSSSVQGDKGQSAALGRAIAASVQAELVKQKRPGGLLA